MTFIPESPQYLVQVQKFQEAEKSLKYFRNTKEEEALEMEEIQTELQLFKDVIEAKKNEEKLTLQDFSMNSTHIKKFSRQFSNNFFRGQNRLEAPLLWNLPDRC